MCGGEGGGVFDDVVDEGTGIGVCMGEVYVWGRCMYGGGVRGCVGGGGVWEGVWEDVWVCGRVCERGCEIGYVGGRWYLHIEGIKSLKE